MKLRLLSDLHIDINRKFNVEIPNNYTYTLIAGDLGGDYKANAEWIKKNVHEGAFISGNHDAYTSDKTPVDDVKEFYHKNFPLDGPVTYFDNDVGVISKNIDEKTILVADVLYTDYKYNTYECFKKYGIREKIRHNMRLASPKMSGSYMNDFNFFTRNGTYKKEKWEAESTYYPKDLFYIRPENYKRHFDRTFRNITRIIEENKDKNVVLMTHHCLSPKVISDRFSKDSLNASYVSDKESWIKKHPNIKLILSGHVHNGKVFNVGNDTKYVLNPLGYLRNFENRSFDYEKNIQVNWTPDLFIDTETWEISRTEYENKEWEKLQTLELAYASAFI